MPCFSGLLDVGGGVVVFGGGDSTSTSPEAVAFETSAP